MRIHCGTDYDVTEDGRVFSMKSGERRELSRWVNSNGYLTTKMNDRLAPIHILVATKYLDGWSDERDTVNHKDGDKLNNSVENLEWVSRVENLHHAMDAGLHAWGRRRVRGVNLTTGHTVEFPSLADAGKSGFTQPNVAHCLAGRRATCKGYKWEYAE